MCAPQLLASNVNTYRAMQSAGEGKASGSGGVEGRVAEAEVKELIERVLEEESLEGKRAAAMDIDDLLALLSAFNEKGVHFA